MQRIAVLTFSLFATISCSLMDDSSDDKSKSNNDEFSFDLTGDDLAASKTCGDAEVDPGEDSNPSRDYDYDKMAAELAGDGLPGIVHGAVHQFGHYVFRYGETLKAEHFNIVPMNEEVAGTFRELARHDSVVLHGHFMDTPAPVQHILVSKVKIVEKYEKYPRDDRQYQLKMDELLSKDRRELLVKVHANIRDGAALVVGISDVVFPVIVSESLREQTKSIYRNDKLKMKLRVERTEPPHFVTDVEAEEPIQVVDSMVNCHGKEVTIRGQAVKFYKSPAIVRDIFAIKTFDPNGIERNFTIFLEFTMEGYAVWEEIMALAANSWEANIDTQIQGRSHVINPKIEFVAKGRMNVTSPNQANPQIVVTAVEDFEIVELD